MSQYRHASEHSQGKKAGTGVPAPYGKDQRQKNRGERSSTLDTLQTSSSNVEPSQDEKRQKQRENAKKASRKVAWIVAHYDQKRAQRIEKCTVRYARYACGACGTEKQIRAFRCGDRLCPVCARIRSSKLVSRWEGALVAYEAGEITGSPRYPYLLTLTLRNGTTLPAREGMQKQYRKLIAHSVWDQFGGVLGALCAVEVTRGKGRKRTFHPHMHALVYFDRPIPETFLSSTSENKTGNGNGKHSELSPIWKQITGDSHIIHLVPFFGSPSEVLKYVTKVEEFEKFPPDMFSHLMDWLKGMRASSTLGELYNMRTAKDDQKENAMEPCLCGSNIVLCSLHVYSKGVYVEKGKYYMTTDGEILDGEPVPG